MPRPLSARLIGCARATSNLQLDAIAHRIVHGGDHVSEPAIADDARDQRPRRRLALRPAAQPCRRSRHCARCAKSSRRYRRSSSPIPRSIGHCRPWRAPMRFRARSPRKHGIHRFGFHGIGHSWMLDRYAEIVDRSVSTLNLITLQLGAGCSAAAIRDGESIDTSMGLTPLEGLMMATRSGDLDPAIFSFLATSERLSPDEVERILNHDSGLLGVSGLSGDMRELEAAARPPTRMRRSRSRCSVIECASISVRTWRSSVASTRSSSAPVSENIRRPSAHASAAASRPLES